MKRYRREEILPPLHVVKELCRISRLSFDSLEIVDIINENWGAVKGGKKGIRILLNKYPESLKDWRAKGGRAARLRHPSTFMKKVILPPIDSRLSEFIGIHLGDGTLTEYFFRIAQDSRYDLPYVEYIKALVTELFGVSPTVRTDKRCNLIYIQLFSKSVCEYLHNRWSMPYGDKMKGQATIPREILENKELAVSCLRGLIDTDGSVSKDGNSISIRFSSYNNALVKQVEGIGKSLGIFTFGNAVETGTKSWPNIIEYFHVVGSSNLRHIVRFHKRFAEKMVLRKTEVVRYYKAFKGISLPFKVDGPVV